MAETVHGMTFEIEVDTATGEARLRSFQQEARKAFDGLNNASRKLDESKRNVQNLGQAFSSFQNTLKATASAFGAYWIGREMIQGFKAVVSAAAEAEDAELRLSVAIRNSGQSVATVLPHLRALANQYQTLVGVEDEAILTGQALLIEIGRLSGAQLERATAAALDLSVKMGSVPAAFEAIARAAAGNTREFSRLGLRFEETASRGEKLVGRADPLGFQSFE